VIGPCAAEARPPGQIIQAENDRSEFSACISLNIRFWIMPFFGRHLEQRIFNDYAMHEKGKKLGKNPTISNLFIVVVIKYSLLKIAAKKGRGRTGSGPKAAVYHYLGY